MYDLIGGRASWTVLGLPTEGHIGDRRRISSVAQQAGSVSIDATIADVVALGNLEHAVAVLSPSGVLLGALHVESCSLPPDTPVDRAMVSAPGTIRPDLRIDEVVQRLRKDKLDEVFVTTVSGVLVGLVVMSELRV